MHLRPFDLGSQRVSLDPSLRAHQLKNTGIRLWPCMLTPEGPSRPLCVSSGLIALPSALLDDEQFIEIFFVVCTIGAGVSIHFGGAICLNSKRSFVSLLREHLHLGYHTGLSHLFLPVFHPQRRQTIVFRAPVVFLNPAFPLSL